MEPINFLVTGEDTAVVKINRLFSGLFGTFTFTMTASVGWESLKGYLDFFQLADSIEFACTFGMIIFFTPLLFYFSYLCLKAAIKNKPTKMNNKINNLVGWPAIFGVVFCFAFSPYLSYSLLSQGYIICPNKISWMSPNKYVRDISLCYKQ